jgi:pyrroloquinoline quinone biosynthesis protein E
MTAPRPYALVSELSYRCPLACPYCSNPIEPVGANDELSTDEWGRVFAEAEALGIVQVHLTGGEPLVRQDLEALASRARALDLYVHLVTSGVPLSRSRLRALAASGVDAVQLSLQDHDPARAARFAGIDVLAKKIAAAEWIREEGLPLTVNVVLHRDNIDHLDGILACAEELRPDRIELANTQYHGWALRNRDALLPTVEQMARARERARAAKERLSGRIEVAFVLPDYFSERPRACMDGWGHSSLVVAPDGVAMPCHGARAIATMTFPSVRDASLAAIWRESSAFARFRGEDWMQEPCRSCEHRARDHGGCRCQAFLLTGDPAATDPACARSPHHRDIVSAVRAERRERRFLYRGRPFSNA